MDFQLLINILYAAVAFILVLIPAIAIHEFGHLLAAKAVGINVLEYGIGFPPRMVKLFRWGETDFTLNWIPLGGFVRPLGEDMIGPVDEQEAEEKAKNDGQDYISERDELIARGVPPEKLKSVNEAKPLQRILFMSAGALANFASAFVLLMVVALLGLPEFLGARVQVVVLGADSAAARAGVVQGDAIERVNGEFFASTEAFVEQYTAAAEPLELEMRSIATQENYTVIVPPSERTQEPGVLVRSVTVNAPAYNRLQPDDIIVAVDGEPFPIGQPATDTLLPLVQEAAGREMRLTVKRASERVEVQVTPLVEPPARQGRLGISIANVVFVDGMLLTGANPQTVLVPRSVGESVGYAANQMRLVFTQIIALPGLLLSGEIDPELARPVSVVGITHIGARFLERSVDEGRPGIILEFIALVSIFLGITNLLPLPPLDGGRIVFVIVEMLRGKPVPFNIELNAYKIGLAFLLGLGVLVIMLDIIRPIQIP